MAATSVAEGRRASRDLSESIKFVCAAIETEDKDPICLVCAGFSRPRARKTCTRCDSFGRCGAMLLFNLFGLDIVSRPGSLTEENGSDEVILGCVIHGEGLDFFFKQVIWSKVLPDRTLQINTGAVINEPFSATGRYSIDMRKLEQKDPIETHMNLVIRDIHLADNGTYKCEIREQETTLSLVEHTMVVPAPIDDLTLFTNSSSTDATGKTSYNFQELVPTYVGCRSVGGNPMPQVRIYRGKADITEEFQTKVKEHKSGEVGLEEVMYDINVYNAAFLSEASHQGKNLKCVSRIHKLPQMKRMVSGTMDVQFPPQVSGCHEESFAYMGKKDHVISCKLSANPPVVLSSVYWMVEGANVTNLTNGESKDGITANVTVNAEDNSIHVSLTFVEVDPASYQKYILRAANALADKHYAIHLVAATTTSTTTQTPADLPGKNDYNIVGKKPQQRDGQMAAAKDSATSLFAAHLPFLLILLRLIC
ncbi:hypothetical protein CAPTEDRAFT_224574 [Capitella teleta]|uniref:Ig-like domain-containing protein n=1 Tax=Capitella teleta TaxID=283909 RepID=R7V9A4_CAPTE|nr:hypothetical protein CAPTEDRAFT_224574 [Capitella teleta]|eukprot:ELU15428.1 hypothetical protein CAPTEDRAFT_224574 [Capitella teleta]